MSSGRHKPWHLPSRLGVSGDSALGHSASLTDAECQGKCRPDDTSDCIGLLDEECQGILLRDAVRLLQMQSVKANVVLMACAMASAFRTTCAMASAFSTRRVRTSFLLDTECQGKCYLDDTSHGICLPDDVCHGIYLPDNECQGIIPYRR